MGTLQIKRLRKVGRRFFWNPSASMKAHGFKSIPLGSDEVLAIQRARELNKKADAPDPLRVPKMGPPPGSLAALVSLYRSSSDFTDLAEKTKESYRKLLAEIETKAGHIQVSSITRQSLKSLYRSLLPRGPRMAKALLQMYSILLSFAVDEGWIKDHPGRKLKLKGSPARRQRWTIHQLNLFVTTAFEMGGAWAAVGKLALLAYALAQRLVDVRKLPWPAYDDALQSFTLTPGKTKDTTGQVLTIKAPDWLQRQMAAWPRDNVVMVVNPNTGASFTENNLSKLARQIRDKAGLPKTLQLRDTRRTALTEAKDGGATITDLQALGGHATLAALQVYVVPTEQASGRAQDARRKGKG